MATQKPVAEEFCLLVGKSLESLLTYLELVFFNVSWRFLSLLDSRLFFFLAATSTGDICKDLPCDQFKKTFFAVADGQCDQIGRFIGLWASF